MLTILKMYTVNSKSEANQPTIVKNRKPALAESNDENK